MAKCSFNFLIVVMCLVVIVLCIAGCGSAMTEENPFGITDPNQIRAWADFVVKIGQSAQVGGVASGNPILIGYGVLLVAATGLVTTVILKKGKGK